MRQSFLDFLASYSDPEQGIGNWDSQWSWVAAMGLQQWIEEAGLDATTEVHLLEEKHSRRPLRVVLNVRLLVAGCSIHCFLAERAYPTVVALVSHFSDAGLPYPLDDPRQVLTLTVQRVLHAGILHDPSMSVHLAHALTERFGPFSVEWLLAMDQKGKDLP